MGTPQGCVSQHDIIRHMLAYVNSFSPNDIIEKYDVGVAYAFG